MKAAVTLAACLRSSLLAGHAPANTVYARVKTALIMPAALAAGLFIAGAQSRPASAIELNDFPTVARADYVFACMKSNGDTREALQNCSCSIDVIATILPYDRYVSAESVLSLSQVPGRFGVMFRSPEAARAAVTDLRRAQAEAEMRCF